MDICVGLVSADVYIFRILSAAKFCHYVLWKVDKDRSRTAGAGNIEGFFDNSAKVFTSAGSNAVLVMLLVIPTMSTSWSASLPMRWRATWPVKHTRGTLS